MNRRKSAMGRSRDLGTGSNGKGSASRISDTAAFDENFSKIEWPVVNVEGFRTVGTKQVKTYGATPKKEWVINPAWVNAPISIDEIVPPYACLDTGPEPALEDFEIWDR